MRRLHRWRELSPEDRRLLLHALLRLGLIRLGLWLFPRRIVRRLQIQNTSHSPTQPGQFDPDRIAWAVSTASRYVPGASCLVQATAAQSLLAGSGYPTTLQIGVTKDENGHLMAHAWVEYHGKVLIGGLDDLSRFRPLRPRDLKGPTDV